MSNKFCCFKKNGIKTRTLFAHRFLYTKNRLNIKFPLFFIAVYLNINVLPEFSRIRHPETNKQKFLFSLAK